MSFKKFKFMAAAIMAMVFCMHLPIHGSSPIKHSQKKGQVKEKKLTPIKEEQKVLYCEGEDGDEKLASARANYIVAIQMLKKAIDEGHVIQDENGLYIKVFGDDCNCLPIVPSAIKPTK